MQQSLQQTISDFEKQYEGTVPPTFGLENHKEAESGEMQPENTVDSAAAAAETEPDTQAEPDAPEEVNAVENLDNALDAR